MRKCIIYYPFHINTSYPSASNIRPMKFIEGFKSAGYEVEVVKGYGEERKKKVKELKEKIKNGEKYDFIYTESATEPTLLTEANHIPMFPFLDFDFFNFCKKRDIKIGLFYRDIYWRFDQYKNSVSLLKRIPAYMFYYYDLLKYKKYLDALYLPSIMMKEYIPIDLNIPTYDLPSGCDELSVDTSSNKKSNQIKILYVGGLDKELYNIEGIVRAICKNEKFALDICCRENEWQAGKQDYEKYLNDRIKVIHKSGKELDEIAMKADFFSLVVESSEYRKFAMPMKLFSYVAYRKPILGIKGTAAGRFIEENNIGYVVNYTDKDIEDMLDHIANNSEKEKNDKLKAVEVAYENNTWKMRAKTVMESLIGK